MAANTNAPFRDAPAGGEHDVIRFDERLFGLSVFLNEELSISGSLSIEGPQPVEGDLTIQANGENRHFVVLADATLQLEYVALKNGRADQGGAVYNEGALYAEHTTFQSNTANESGGALWSGGLAVLSNSRLYSNEAAASGGAVYSTGRIAFSGSVLEQNRAGDSGGAVRIAAGVGEFYQTQFTENSAADAGGALEVNGAMRIEASGFLRNSAGGSGGALALVSDNTVIVNSSFLENSARQAGGAFALALGTAELRNTTIALNVAGTTSAENSHGGGIASGGRVSLKNSIVAGNVSGSALNRNPDDLLATDSLFSEGLFTSEYSIIGDPQTAGGLADGKQNNKVGQSGQLLPTDQLFDIDAESSQPVRHLSLTQDSPALDFGNNDYATDVHGRPLLSDGRGAGFPRRLFGTAHGEAVTDAGAVEFRPDIPVLTSAEAAVHTGRLSFHWQAGKDADAYEIWLENRSSGQTGRDAVFFDRNYDELTYERSGLPDGEYEFWIRSVTEGTRGPWVRRRILLSTIPELQAVQPRSSTAGISITWLAQPDTVSSEIWVSRISGERRVESIRFDSQAGMNVAGIDELAFGRYAVWVRTLNSAGVWSRWSAPSTVWVTPEPETPIQPTHNTRPVFSWTDLADILEYEIQIQQGPESDRIGGLIEPRYQSGDDLSPGNHLWWVRARNSDGWGPWSETAVFNAEGRPIPEEAHLAAESPLVTFRWSGPSDGQHYEVWIAHADTGRRLEHQRVITEEVTAALPDSGRYNFWVRSFGPDGRYGPWSQAVSVERAAPAGILRPEPLQALPTFSSTPTLNWTAPEGAELYSVFLVNEQLTAHHGIIDIAATEWTSDTALPQGTYRWFVQAANALGDRGPWIAGDSFHIGGRTEILSPNGATDSSRPLFRWKKVIRAERYVLHVEDAAGNVILYRDRLPGDRSKYQAPNDLAVGQYRVWIRSIDARGGDLGPWSEAVTFVIS